MRVLRAGIAVSVLLWATGALSADCTEVEAIGQYAANQIAPQGARCVLYLSDAGTSGTSCHWEFPFRDQAAQRFSDALWQSLVKCRTGRVLGADQRVNHPDSYDLREWETRPGTYAISVKDKGALNQTLVFFRFERVAGD